MDNIKLIGTRTSLLIKENVFSIIILPTDNKRKTNLLFFWLLAWSASGAIVFANYFKLTQESTKLFVIIWLGFWGYFEFTIARVFMWKRFGKEKIWIKNGQLNYKQDINGRGKTKQYDLNLISQLELIELEKGNFADVFAQTFWVKGGQRIGFFTQTKYVKIGMQLSDDDAKKIITEINKYVKKIIS